MLKCKDVPNMEGESLTAICQPSKGNEGVPLEKRLGMLFLFDTRRLLRLGRCCTFLMVKPWDMLVFHCELKLRFGGERATRSLKINCRFRSSCY